ncbi:retrovirus-related pol polyprotein from transposon TNT 1-94 [Tanacetum coccineum]
MYGRVVYEYNLISWRYPESKKALITAPISTTFFSNHLIQDLQENFDDEVNERNSDECLKDLHIEFHEIALHANSKHFTKRNKSKFIGTKSFENTQCYKCGKSCHYEKDCFSKTSVPSYKASGLNYSSGQTSFNQNQFSQDEEEVTSNDEEIVKVRVLLALSNEEKLIVGKNNVRNDEWVNITMRKSLALTGTPTKPESSKDSELEPQTSLPPLKIIQGVFPSSETNPYSQASSSKSVSGTIPVECLEASTPLVPKKVKDDEQESKLNGLTKLVQMLNVKVNSSQKVKNRFEQASALELEVLAVSYENRGLQGSWTIIPILARNQSNIRIPLPKFFYKVLNYFKVHILRFNPFALAKLTTFVVMCKAYGGEPTVEILRAFLNLGPAVSINNETQATFVEPINTIDHAQFAKNMADLKDSPSTKKDVVLVGTSGAGRIKHRKVNILLKSSSKRKQAVLAPFSKVSHKKSQKAPTLGSKVVGESSQYHNVSESSRHG